MAINTKKLCSTCKHEALNSTQRPCMVCWQDIAKPNWESKENAHYSYSLDDDRVSISVPQIAVSTDTGLKDIPQELLDSNVISVIKEDLDILLNSRFGFNNTDDKNSLRKIKTAIDFLGEHHIIMRKGLGFEIMRTRDLKSMENRVDHLEAMISHLKQLLDPEDIDAESPLHHMEQLSALDIKYNKLDGDRKDDLIIFNTELERMKSVVRDSETSILQLNNKVSENLSLHDMYVKDSKQKLNDKTEGFIADKNLLEAENQRLESLVLELTKRLEDIGESSVEIIWGD